MLNHDLRGNLRCEPKHRAVWAIVLLAMAAALGAGNAMASEGSKPNIVFIMGDDIGMWNIGAYHRGMMAGRTPNIDELAADGAIFTDYYAEASCTAGRANFITGELPIRTGLTTVGQAGAKIGIPAQAVTIATALKDMGYATGQFGKNHLGDRNEYLPTVHGFDEFFGYLYHLDATEDPWHPNYPKDLLDKVGPRDVLHTWATDKDDPTVDPRWGKVGKQKIVDEGPLPPHPTEGVKLNMETIDNVILEHTFNFMEKAQKDGKPFFIWLNPTRMHVFTHLAPKYEAMQNPENGWTIEEAGMAQFDDIIGDVMKKLDEMGVADNTIVAVTTDNGAPTASVGPTGAPRRSRGGRAWAPRAASGYRLSSAGQARSSPTRSSTASCPGWTGSPPSSLRQATRVTLQRT
jgi:arylsulfatase A-like enzyme